MKNKSTFPWWLMIRRQVFILASSRSFGWCLMNWTLTHVALFFHRLWLRPLPTSSVLLLLKTISSIVYRSCTVKHLLNQWVLESLLPWHPLLFLNLQAFLYEILTFLRYIVVKWNWPCLHVVYELHLAVGRPGSLPIDHLIKYKSNRPQIWLVRIWLFIEDLRGHIKRSSHNRF